MATNRKSLAPVPSIYKVGRRYRAQGPGPNGKRISGTGATKAEAKGAYEARLRGLRPRAVTVGTCLAAWMETERSQVRASTLATYANQIENVLERVIDPALELKALTEEAMGHVISELQKGWASTSAKAALWILSAALDMAVQRRWISDNPVADRAIKGSTKRQGFWTLTEARRFLDIIAGDRIELLYAVMLLMGLRVGEACVLTWEHWDITGRLLFVAQTETRGQKGRGIGPPKSNAGTRTLPIPALIQRLTVKVAQPSDYCFSVRGASPISTAAVRLRLRSICDANGLPYVGPHGLRRSAGAQWLLKGVHPLIVSRYLGHDHLSTTLKEYAPYLDEMEPALRAAIQRAFPVVEVIG
jgi:integrase